MIGFSVVSVLMGVFIQDTFKIATSDDHIMLRQEEREMKTHTRNMEKLFGWMDISGDGTVDLDEFEALLDEHTGDPAVRKWLAAMGFHVDDVSSIFKLIDDGDGSLSAEELICGAKRLKGDARSLDLMTLISEHRGTRELLLQALGDLRELRSSSRRTSAGPPDLATSGVPAAPASASDVGSISVSANAESETADRGTIRSTGTRIYCGDCAELKEHRDLCWVPAQGSVVVPRLESRAAPDALCRRAVDDAQVL